MRKWYPALLVALTIALGIYAYPRLPDRVPAHWNVHGVVNRYTSRTFFLVPLPLFVLALWGLLRVLPRIDPWRENYPKFQGTYDLVVNCALTVIALADVAVVGRALGSPVPLDRVMPGVVGVLLVIIGNVMPRARPNFWFGIRTPWTLTNPRVWERTHRFAGYVFVLAGVVGILSAFVGASIAPRTVGIAAVAAALIMLIYSYFVWRQEISK
jgi:uncharacterized membrane protein